MHAVRAFDVEAELAARPVDAVKAKTRREADKAKIDGFVEAMPGGFERLNATITTAIKEAAAVIARQFSASSIARSDKRLRLQEARARLILLSALIFIFFFWLFYVFVN